jgi:hypothetical protein
MNYLILSPGRSGSVMLARYLAQYLNKTYVHIDEYDGNLTNCVLHVHDVSIAQKFINYQILLVRRSPVEIAASIMLAKSTGVFHFKRDEQDTTNQTSKEEYINRYKDTIFEIDIKEYLHLVQTYIDWYLSTENIVSKSIIFSYEEAIDISSINQKLNLSANTTCKMSLPIAQPWDKWEKIKDGKLIKSAGNKLFLPYIKRHKNIFA